MRPKVGSVTHFIECSDTTLKVFSKWKKKFGSEFKNSDGRTVYTRYVGEQHVKEDCYGYIPSAKEWLMNLQSKNRPQWMIRTLKMNNIDPENQPSQ